MNYRLTFFTWFNFLHISWWRQTGPGRFNCHSLYIVLKVWLHIEVIWFKLSPPANRSPIAIWHWSLKKLALRVGLIKKKTSVFNLMRHAICHLWFLNINICDSTTKCAALQSVRSSAFKCFQELSSLCPLVVNTAEHRKVSGALLSWTKITPELELKASKLYLFPYHFN